MHQTDFELAVGSDPDWSIAELWNPPPFESSDTFIVYDGSTIVDGETYYIRIRVSNGINWSTWYEFSFRMNSIPTIPVQLSPIDDAFVEPQPDLWIQNSIDAEDDILSYDFEVYEDPAADFPIASGYGIQQQPDSTSWTVDVILQENQQFFWITRAFDQYEYSDWASSYESFWVNDTPEPPTAPELLYPIDDTLIVYNLLTTFIWASSSDPDPFDTIHYKLIISLDSNFTFISDIDSIQDTTLTLTVSLEYDTHYWWKVEATDKTNLTTASAVKDFWTTCCKGIRGNIDGLGEEGSEIDIADLVYFVDYSFSQPPGPEPPCPDEADVDGSANLDIADIVYLVDYMFSQPPGPTPVDCP